MFCCCPGKCAQILPEAIGRRRVTTWDGPHYLDRRPQAIAAAAFAYDREPGGPAQLSKQGCLSDTAGHWHPHLMFFFSKTDPAAWGAGLQGSPILAFQRHLGAAYDFPGSGGGVVRRNRGPLRMHEMVGEDPTGELSMR